MREEGYYWTRNNLDWYINEWDGSEWLFDNYHSGGDDSFDEIDERRIVRVE